MDKAFKSMVAALGLLVILAAAPGLANSQENVAPAEKPGEIYTPETAPTALRINRIKINDGCYEVYGTDGKGQRAETYFNPKSFEVVKEG